MEPVYPAHPDATTLLREHDRQVSKSEETIRGVVFFEALRRRNRRLSTLLLRRLIEEKIKTSPRPSRFSPSV